MSKRTLYLLGMLLTIIITSFLQYTYCCNCKCNKDDVEVTAKMKDATLLPFVVKDANGDLSLNINDNFNFKESNLRFLSPVSANVDAGIEKIKAYLDANKDKTLSITGLYKSSEVNNSVYPNLGLARANTVKNYFVRNGISSRFIDTYGKLNDDMVADSLNVYHGPVAFDIKTMSKDDAGLSEASLKEIADEIRKNPLVLHFDTGKSTVNLTPEQREKFVKISRYLDKVEDASCLIIGHTDNTGNADSNMQLGQNRANFAKDYLVNNAAIVDTKIEAISKGQTQPIADNTTEEGKAQNRRTVITLK